MTDLPYDGDPLDEPVNHPLLGRRVRVVIARQGTCATEHEDPYASHDTCTGITDDDTVVGVLERLDAGGSFDIRLDCGQVRYCWPALDITEEQP